MLLQESFSVWKGGHPEEYMHTAFWVLFLGAPDIYLDLKGNILEGQINRQLGSTHHESHPQLKSALSLDTLFSKANTFSFVFLLGGVGFCLVFQIVVSIILSLAYSFWALVIFTRKMETNSISPALLIRLAWNCSCKMSSVIRI